MRILLSGVPAFGHLLPLAPLAAAALRAGHDVRLLTSGGIGDLIAPELPGVRILAAGPMPDRIFEEVALRFSGSNPAIDPRPETVADFFAGSRVDLTFDEALSAARTWVPDIVIAEATDFVGPMIASALSVPWSVLAFGPAVPEAFTAPMFALAAAQYDKRRIVPTAPTNYIDPSPRSLQLPSWTPTVHHLPLRPEPHRRNPPARLDSPFRHSAAKSKVLVTLGTVFSDSSVLRAIIESIDLSRFDVVATTGLVDRPREFEDEVTYVGFTPLAELLEDADIVVTSGGAGTVLASLSRGLPMVIFPQGADQFINSQRAAAAGCAVVVSQTSEVGPALRTVLSDAGFTAAAGELADEISMSPTAADVLEELERQIARNAK
ncbi:glycosyltransferase [Herbiconiux daphne]|uniref:Glycosyltransferase n=1 Tax=Herbiconiux daphne TaxID=2970914 RepID=A0ABT2H583_9MICO|nr:glycosyltransferase [Herbiconiux daphne]MCS5735088.1 glycosyltransferase [Herbiconiux daphne]